MCMRERITNWDSLNKREKVHVYKLAVYGITGIRLQMVENPNAQNDSNVLLLVIFSEIFPNIFLSAAVYVYTAL